MKVSAILFMLLLVSMIYSYYLYTELEKTKLVLTDTTCFKDFGFGEARTISEDQAKSFSIEYKRTLTDPDSITGGLITRAAFDSLLCDSAVNGIAYFLARDTTGTIGPGGNGVFLFLTGVNVTVEGSTGAVESVKTLDLPLYIPQHWCPPTCLTK